MLESLGHVADGSRGHRVDRVPALGGGGGDVGLVEDEEASRREPPEPLAKTDEVVLVTEQGVADEELAVRGPRVDPEASLAAACVDVRLVHDHEAETEPLRKLVSPLEQDGRRARDDDSVDALAKEKLLEDEPRFDRLAQADVVRDEQVDPRKGQGLSERFELIVLRDDPGSQRSLKKRGVRRRHAAPLEGVEVRREDLWVVRLRLVTQRASPRRHELRIDLARPDDGELLALGVVIDAGEIDDRCRVGRRAHVLDEVGALTDADQGSDD